MADQRLRELLIRAELEDCKLLEKDDSPFLEFWRIVGVAPEAAGAEAGLNPPPAGLVFQ